MEFIKRNFNIIIKSILVISFFAYMNNADINREYKIKNVNLNKSLDLASMTAFADSLTNTVSIPKIENITVLANFTGRLTGYVYNCPKCTGRLSCKSDLDLSTGNVNYEDAVYGSVRIVASSKNLPCGSIVNINNNDGSAIMAIVLDRGVSNTSLDLLVPELSDAYLVGNHTVEYELLRNGWE